MANFANVYSLIQINDGLRCVYRNEDGTHYVGNKTDKNSHFRLLFASEKLALDYISNHADLRDCRPERMLYNEDFLPPSLIRE